MKCEEKENKRKALEWWRTTQSPRVQPAGGKNFTSILFSSKAEHCHSHLVDARACACVLQLGFQCVCAWRRACYKALSFTYRAPGPQELSGL